MNTEQSKLLSGTVRRMLRPLARLLLRYGFSYGAFAEAAKHAFIDAAQTDLGLPGRKQTTSRISTVTGLTRKEVHRLTSESAGAAADNDRQLNRAARVISGWLTDPRFVDKSGSPRILALDDSEHGFLQLVKSYSGDIPYRTITDELMRIDAIEITSSGALRLTKQAYVPSAGSQEKLEIMADDVVELMDTITHNLEAKKDTEMFFQRKVYYDNIPQENHESLKMFINQAAQECLEKINKELARHDRDNHPGLKGTGRLKMGLGIHYFEEEIE